MSNPQVTNNGLREIFKSLTQDLRYCQVAQSAFLGFCRLNSSAHMESVTFAARELRNARDQLAANVKLFSKAVDNITQPLLEGNGKEEEPWQDEKRVA